MEVDEAFDLISRAIDAGHAANGYLIVGDVRGNCEELVRSILGKLFPEEAALVEANSHPDVFRLEPSGKSRTIKVAQTTVDPAPGMRDAIIEPMSQTSFSGGWKVGVIAGADRLQSAAANAFLKSLEEPRPKILYLLLTDQPDLVMPTVLSRCQRIDLPLPEGILEGDAYEEVAAAFAARDVAKLVETFGGLKEDAEDADIPLVRKAFFRTLLSFTRKMMLGGRLPAYQAYRNIEAVEDAYRQNNERNMGDEQVLSFLMDRIVFPS